MFGRIIRTGHEYESERRQHQLGKERLGRNGETRMRTFGNSVRRQLIRTPGNVAVEGLGKDAEQSIAVRRHGTRKPDRAGLHPGEVIIGNHGIYPDAGELPFKFAQRLGRPEPLIQGFLEVRPLRKRKHLLVIHDLHQRPFGARAGAQRRDVCRAAIPGPVQGLEHHFACHLACHFGQRQRSVLALDGGLGETQFEADLAARCVSDGPWGKRPLPLDRGLGKRELPSVPRTREKQSVDVGYLQRECRVPAEGIDRPRGHQEPGIESAPPAVRRRVTSARWRSAGRSRTARQWV